MTSPFRFLRARWPLRYSIPAALGLLGTALTAIAFYGGWSNTKSLVEEEMQAKLVSLGTRISGVMEDRFTRGEDRLVADAVYRTIDERYLDRATFLDQDSQALVSTDANVRIGAPLAMLATNPALRNALATATQTLAAQYLWSADRMHVYGVFPVKMQRRPQSLREAKVGALLIEFDLEEVKRIYFSKHLRRAWIMGAVIVVSLLFVWLYLSRAVTRRLTGLAEALEATAIGAQTARDIADVDELGRFGRTIRRIIGELHARSEALRVSEARYRGVVHAMSEGVVIFGGNGRVLAANDSAARMAGSKELDSRAISDPPWEILSEKGRPLRTEEYPPSITLATGATIMNRVLGFRSENGDVRWISVNSEPLMLGSSEERGAVVTMTDITERRRADLEARRDRERLATIIDSAMDAVISTDDKMRVTVFNRAAERIFGRTEAEMLGQPLDMLLPERFRAMHAAVTARFASTGESRRPMGTPGNVVGLRANGEEFPLEASIARAGVEGETMLTVVMRDLSDRVRAEEQRRHLEAQLRQSQKMQSLGTLTGGIAHDFNNILMAITGNVKLAMEDLPSEHPVQRSLAEIDKSAARATDLVRQVLAFGRRQEPQRVAADMAAVVGDALAFLRPMLPASIEIHTRFPSGLPLVSIDRTQVHQVITNLASNAAHAIGHTAGQIEVTLADVQLSLEEARRSPDLRAGRYVLLIVADTGSGIESDIIDRIFEPFFTTKAPGQGTGLGLSVVHGIMRNHDGAIVVHSAVGAGTRFELYFPVASASEARLPAENDRPRRTPSAGNGKTVMYVDDEEPLVFLVVRMLERHGYRVLGFDQPKLAVAELANSSLHVDALISDLAMPGMTGFDLARRARELRPTLPVILVSGYIRPQDMTAAQSIGVQRLIVKPDTVDALAEALHELLSTHSDQ